MAAKLGRRERQEKRVRLGLEYRALLLRKELARQEKGTNGRIFAECKKIVGLYKPHGDKIGGPLTPENLEAMTHKTRCYVGRSPGCGDSQSVFKAKRKSMARAGINPHPFLPSFMAPGHEVNATLVKHDKTLQKVKSGVTKKGKPRYKFEEIASPETGISNVARYTEASNRALMNADMVEKAAKRDPLGRHMFKE